MGKRTVTLAESVEIRRERVQDTFKLDPTVIITLKGKDYTHELTNASIKGILKATAFNLLSTGFTPSQMEDPEVMGAILYWGLVTHHPDLTQDQVDAMFSYRHYPYMLEKLRQSVAMILPDVSDIEVERKEPAPKADVDPTLPQASNGSGTGPQPVL